MYIQIFIYIYIFFLYDPDDVNRRVGTVPVCRLVTAHAYEKFEERSHPPGAAAAKIYASAYAPLYVRAREYTRVPSGIKVDDYMTILGDRDKAIGFLYFYETVSSKNWWFSLFFMEDVD